MLSFTGMTFLWYYSTVSMALLSTLYPSHFDWSIIWATNPVRLYVQPAPFYLLDVSFPCRCEAGEPAHTARLTWALSRRVWWSSNHSRELDTSVQYYRDVNSNLAGVVCIEGWQVWTSDQSILKHFAFDSAFDLVWQLRDRSYLCLSICNPAIFEMALVRCQKAFRYIDSSIYKCWDLISPCFYVISSTENSWLKYSVAYNINKWSQVETIY